VFQDSSMEINYYYYFEGWRLIIVKWRLLLFECLFLFYF